ncbi:hypothetical protein OS493_004860 [Desmophyllum pertusum]|uniref:Uncharacterized protein n=1 Tax=Desmophyllum pertusum TaxID=174260 RepID=A0A9W9Z3M5_9CNID|nr:hypothetical protein OS493_004860 [Desmophyllum pertusum]
MASSWSVGVGSLVKAYLGNPVIIIPDMIEAAMYRGVQQVVAFLQRKPERCRTSWLRRIYFTPTKDICICVIYSRQRQDKIGKLLNCKPAN